MVLHFCTHTLLTADSSCFFVSGKDSNKKILSEIVNRHLPHHIPHPPHLPRHIPHPPLDLETN